MFLEIGTRHVGYSLSRRFFVICGSGSTCLTAWSRSRRGKASRRGEILNDLPDRISDIVIFVGVAHSGLMNPLIGYWAAIFAVLTSYVGLFGQALGVQRQFGGVMSKPWRMVALHAGAWLTFFLAPQSFATFTILDWTCLIVIAGCVETIVVRLKRIITALQDKR